MTTAVVLAAGLGRRLAGHSGLPKWLTPVAETTPADQQLAALARTGHGSAIAVVSPDPTLVAEKTEAWETRLAVELVVNDQAATLNNWFTLLTALERPGVVDDDVLVLNSDLIGPVSWFEAVISGLVGCGGPAAVAVDPRRGRTEEAMKVSVADGRVREIGKHAMADVGGEYVGVAWWSAPAAVEIRAILRTFLAQPERADNWYEHAIQVHLEGGGDYRAVPVPSSDWVEIDDGDDLAAATDLARRPDFGA